MDSLVKLSDPRRINLTIFDSDGTAKQVQGMVYVVLCPH